MKLINEGLLTTRILHSLNIWKIILLIIFSGYSIYYLAGVPSVPFHPDESTQLFMSSDIDLLLTQPSQLLWSVSKETDLHQIYRELDPPLMRYLIGLGRLITNQGMLVSDWRWDQDWESNVRMGAMPSFALLITGRYAVAFLFPLTLLFIYLLGKKIDTSATGILAAALVALNPYILLHTRRAMAESALLFLIVFSIFMIITYSIVWLYAFCAALTVSAKQTGIFVLPLAAFALIRIKPFAVKRWFFSLLGLVSIFLALSLFLNPFLWSNPVMAIRSAVERRTILNSLQSQEIQQASPGKVSTSLGGKALGLIANSFFSPPAFADVGNYRRNTAASELAYQTDPINTLFSGWTWGTIFLIFSLVGFILALSSLIKKRDWSSPLAIFMLGNILFVLVYLMGIQIAFQRYALPMVLFDSMWIAYSIVALSHGLTKRIARSMNQPR